MVESALRNSNSGLRTDIVVRVKTTWRNQTKRLAASKIESTALTHTQRTNRPAYANSGRTDRDWASWVPKSHHSNPSIPWCVWRVDGSSRARELHRSSLPFLAS